MLRLVISLIVVSLLAVSCEVQDGHQYHNRCPPPKPCICDGNVVVEPSPRVPQTSPSHPDGVSRAKNPTSSSSEESSEEHGAGHPGHDHGQGQGLDNVHNHGGPDHDHLNRGCPQQPPCVCPKE